MKLSRMTALCLLLLLCLFPTGCNGREQSSKTAPSGSQTTAPSDSAGSVSEPIRAVEIDWTAGSVKVEAGDVETVTFSETANQELTEETALYHTVRNGTLHLSFTKGRLSTFSNLTKDLTVTVPQALLDEISVDTASSSTELTGVQAKRIEVESASGSITLREIAACDEAELDTASGAIYAVFSCGLRELDAASSSGSIDITAQSAQDFDVESVSDDCRLTFAAAPAEGSVETSSGAITLVLPPDADFTAEVETVSGTFDSDFDLTRSGSVYRCGSGQSRYELESVSGRIEIKKQP